VAFGFAFERHVVRIVMQDDEPWFVAADVCRAMQLAADKRSYSAHLEKL
jgi:prophage antirepressor-like protein